MILYSDITYLDDVKPRVLEPSANRVIITKSRMTQLLM